MWTEVTSANRLPSKYPHAQRVAFLKIGRVPLGEFRIEIIAELFK
jgi:hypothetical protein